MATKKAASESQAAIPDDEKIYAVDDRFAHIVHMAAAALDGKGHAALRAAVARKTNKRKRGKPSTVDLIEYLRSDEPIGAGERRYLADLFSGEMGKPKYAPHLSWGEIDRRRKIIESIETQKKDNIRNGLRVRAAVIVAEIADRNGIDVSTLRSWRRDEAARHRK
jgi:hypothetical protein